MKNSVAVRGIGGIKKRLNKLKYVLNNHGDGYEDVLIKMLIGVIVGIALLALMKTAVPDLFDDIIDGIKSHFAAGL